MLKSVELELVQYRTDEIMHATTRLIHNFARYSGIVGTDSWVRMIGALIPLVKDQCPIICDLKTPALDIMFSGFLEPIPKIEEEKVIFSSREPRFVFEEKRNDDIRPTTRTHVQRVVEAITREMCDVYRLSLEHKDPIVLTFPKKEYAKSVDVFNATMLN